ncbi:hypothetical protein JB92DRAFT_3047485 [Gautieria morchelliformis]|nr:hypothetical protein JB92DRAFT_3047485 [Gautieria morchelliformis]
MSQTVTDTLPAQILISTGHGTFPTTLATSTITLPKLDRQQAGHLRHFHNLASQPDGEWAHMETQEQTQDWLDAYRYQLATMAYAAGAAHYHRLQVLRGLFQELLLKLIHKMLRKEVWGYWYLTSQSGKGVDPDITELRRPWADPIVRENIMVSSRIPDDSMYPAQSLGFITRVDQDRINVNTTDVAFTLRRLAKEENCDVNDLAVVARARDIASVPLLPAGRLPLPLPIFGYVVKWVSEVSSSPDDLAGLLNHADHFLGPTWENGGLFYPRCDTLTDKDGNWTQVERFTGNAGIGYARLNVPNGQRRMWDAPWTTADVQGRAWVDGVGLGTGVDFLRGGWDDGVGGMVLTMKTWHGGDVSVKPVVKGLEEGLYGIYFDGNLSETKAVEKPGDEVLLEVVVGAKDVDVVLKRAN